MKVFGSKDRKCSSIEYATLIYSDIAAKGFVNFAYEHSVAQLHIIYNKITGESLPHNLSALDLTNKISTVCADMIEREQASK